MNRRNAVILIVICICTIFALFHLIQDSKPEVKIIAFGKAPMEELSVFDASVLKEKKSIEYAFKYISDEGNSLNSQLYLAAHPEDAILKKKVSTGKSKLIVYSNSEKPDPEFFREQKNG